jgi:hypothetical protein
MGPPLVTVNMIASICYSCKSILSALHKDCSMASPTPQDAFSGSTPSPGGESTPTAMLAGALAHDLSNALEIIMQTSFLLGTLDLGENGKQWHKMLDSGVDRAIAINKQLREALREES